MFRKDVLIALFLFCLSFLIFICGLEIHGIEYRDDEIFYFKSTQEMVLDHAFLSPTYFGENRFQKPILFYWLILFSYKLFGMNWFAARLVGSLFGSLTIVLTWLIAREFFDRKLSTLSCFILMTVPLFFRHAKNAVPDMPFNFFIVLAMVGILKFISVPAPANKKYSLLFFTACALGFMIKGFAAILIPGLVLIVTILWRKKYHLFREMNFGLGICILLGIILPWFLIMIKNHGVSYLQYMLFDETKYRILGAGEGNIFLNGWWMLGEHSLFYLRIILSYFAPWSLFFFLSLPFMGRHPLVQEKGVVFCLIWIGMVFLFFSSLYFAINHYLLILTTPFAILTSFFFLRGFNKPLFIPHHKWWGFCRGNSEISSFIPAINGGAFRESRSKENRLEKTLFFIKKYLMISIVTAGWIVCSFFFVTFLKMPKGWLGAFLCLYFIVVFIIHKIEERVAAPLLLSIFMLSVMTPSSFFLSNAGLSAHSTFQQLVKTLSKELARETIIAVGSHDIHEKEIQVFFDRPIKKIASDYDPQTRAELANLFHSSVKVYCFILEKDFDKFIKGAYNDVDVLQEEYIIRKRVSLDASFFWALLRFDQKIVRDYLLEKIYLIQRDPHG